MSPVAPISQEGFEIVPGFTSGAVVLKVTGSCDSHTTPLLERFLGEIHAEAVRLGAKSLTLDCEGLYFMNSSAVKILVTWLTKVRALAPNERYGVTARLNRHLAWQARTFGVIARSVPEALTLA